MKTSEIREGLDPKCSRDGAVCSRADGTVCNVYAFPAAKWRNGDCPMADNDLRETTAIRPPKGKVRVGQQKQQKRR